ncbi:MAG: hypothetical protein SF187_21980 [Deltaproteobacteria bacterium]|nr:hypothetical protein [Deltaproteobacteria bacterium]
MPDASTPPDATSPSAPSDPDRFWLERIGTGSAQRQRVCERGADDPVARALCTQAAPAITSLADLYLTLGIAPERSVYALGSSSSGLSFRTVSALNPRLFALTFSDLPGQTLDNVAITAFTRGEQQVELVGYDHAADRLNFYLLVFDQDCNVTGCKAHDLLSPAIERDWRAWTLYDATDLQDTPLDCSSCHQPGGAGTPTRLLMRDLPEPWFHWLPYIGEPTPCPDGTFAKHSPPDLRVRFEHAHSSDETYGGVPLDKLKSTSGHNLHSALLRFQVDRKQSDVGGQEPHIMPSRNVLDEYRCQDTTATWQAYRKPMRNQGLPVPFFAFNGLDPARAVEAQEDFPAFVQAHKSDGAFDVLSNLLSDEFQQAVGGRSEDTLEPQALLQQMCSRCHNALAPVGSARARFAIDRITRDSAAEAVRRLTLPADSPYVMPPRRAGSLTPASVAALKAWLLDR